MKTSRKDLLDYLGDAEKKYPVETWTIKDINIWPMVKINLFFQHVSLERKPLPKKNTPKKTILKIWGIIYGSFQSLISYLWLKSSANRDVIPYFFSDSGSHRVWFEKKYINRYFDPIEEQIKEIRNPVSSLKINDDLQGYQNYPKEEDVFFIHRYIRGAKIIRLLKHDIYHFNCDQFGDFLEEIKKKFPELRIKNSYKEELKSKVFHLLVISDIVGLLIERHKPKVIFELCYYSTLRFAINYSAYKKNIPTIEIQHGGLGSEHVAYSGWGKVPDKGYNLLPQTFWAWDRNSEQIVREWSKNNLFHQTVLGGNPWLMFALKHSHQYHFHPNKKIILFTLQADLVSEYIYEAITNSSDYYEWWVRSHPRFPQVGVIFKKELEKRGISHRVVYERANEYPLPILLNKSGIHLSGNSGSILEASLLGKRSLILDKIGEKYYQKLIESGEAFPVYPKNAAHLLLLINKLFNPTPTEERLIQNGDIIELLEKWV